MKVLKACLVVLFVAFVMFFLCPLRGENQQTALGSPNFWRGQRANTGFNAIVCEVRYAQRLWTLREWEERNYSLPVVRR